MPILINIAATGEEVYKVHTVKQIHRLNNHTTHHFHLTSHFQTQKILLREAFNDMAIKIP